jgi:hypothetical protein
MATLAIKTEMKNGKKDFFNNPAFRVWIYLIAWAFLACFRVFTLFNSKWDEVVANYEDGHFISTAIISFTSGIVYSISLVLFTYVHIDWTAKNIIILVLIYLMIGLMGMLSLVKYRDYTAEKDKNL